LDRGGFAAEGSSWRRAQRVRRLRMTRRGRATIATALGAALVACLWLLEPGKAVRAIERQHALPGVAAAPELEASERPRRVPDDVFMHLPVSRAALELPASGGDPELGKRAHLYEQLDVSRSHPEIAGPLRVEYTLDRQLTEAAHEVMRRGRVELGTVVVMEPRSGRVLAYAATDPERFPPTRTYPAASLVKVITAATALDLAPQAARLPCRFNGSPYRLTPARIDPPSRGSVVTLERALATSNNQCFAQLAVHALGEFPLMEAIGRFGWLAVPAPMHQAGSADPGADRYDLGRLGSGLAGTRITPLHAAQLAASLAQGELVTPQWIERVVDANGRELPIPAATRRRVMSPELTNDLRTMLMETTRSGTARRAFRARGGRPLLGEVRVAGKTGSLSGRDPDGRYEWFIGVAPADDPRIAVATVLVNGKIWYRSASQVAADVLHEIFCERRCDAENGLRVVTGTQAPDPLQRPAPDASSSEKAPSRRAASSPATSPPAAAMSSVSRGSSTRS
jgi:membrane peptidoglycan carboxypeptidase